jgi:dihydropteroate synthase
MKPKDTFFSRNFSLNCNGQLIDLSSPKIMGILNITPDSFYDGGRYTTKEAILNRVGTLLDEGADIVDIGAYSSRPGAQDISVEEELKRLHFALGIIREKYPEAILSVDTFRADVAKSVVTDYKVAIINDITAGEADPEMFDMVAELQVVYILMHMKGIPQNMHLNPSYDNMVKEIFGFFSKKINFLKSLGVNDIIIDPGFGFGKTIIHNYQLLNQLDTFKIFELPLMIGLSRKSMIYKVLDTTPEKALNGTTALNILALVNGTNILRVHDVAPAVETLRLFERYVTGSTILK